MLQDGVEPEQRERGRERRDDIRSRRVVPCGVYVALGCRRRKEGAWSLRCLTLSAPANRYDIMLKARAKYFIPEKAQEAISLREVVGLVAPKPLTCANSIYSTNSSKSVNNHPMWCNG